MQSAQLKLEPGDQKNFTVEPDASRRYTFQTFGESDMTLVLFEIVDGAPRFRAGDDDSGEDRNASFSEKLFADRKYILRVRVAWAFDRNDTAVMYW